MAIKIEVTQDELDLIMDVLTDCSEGIDQYRLLVRKLWKQQQEQEGK